MTAQNRAFMNIPGWFRWIDMLMFRTMLESQADSAPGTLVELGTYLGKSAVVIGDYVRAGDRFVVLDLYGRTDLLTASGQDAANRREAERSYSSLDRSAFEQNYLTVHDQLPDIVVAPSSVICDHVEPGSVRFLHIDASHLYPHVRQDAANARTLLRPDGIVIFDDWRAEHTPGVTFAVFEAVYTDGLRPIAVTPGKFYATYGDPLPYQERVRKLMVDDAEVWGEEQEILGQPLPRLDLARRSTPPMSEWDVDRVADKLADRLRDRGPADPSVPGNPTFLDVSFAPGAVEGAGSGNVGFGSGGGWAGAGGGGRDGVRG